jgi:hypothetical protein
MKRATIDSAVPVGSIPVAATDASTKPDSTDARLVTLIQISASMTPERHSVSALLAAIWVLPHAPSQFCEPSAKAEPGTSATVDPGTSASVTPRAVSGRLVYPSASGGTLPTRNRRDPGSAGIPPEGTTARYPHLFIRSKTSSEYSIHNM